MLFNNLKSFQKLNLIQNANIPLAEKALLFSLKSYEPHIFVSKERLAIQAGTTTRTIKRHLSKLRELNLITEFTQPGRTTTRKINYSELAKISLIKDENTGDTYVPPQGIPGTLMSPPGDTHVPPPGTPTSPEVPILSNNLSAKSKNETNVSSGEGNGGQGAVDERTPLGDDLGWDTDCGGFAGFRELKQKLKTPQPQLVRAPEG